MYGGLSCVLEHSPQLGAKCVTHDARFFVCNLEVLGEHIMFRTNIDVPSQPHLVDQLLATPNNGRLEIPSSRNAQITDGA